MKHTNTELWINKELTKHISAKESSRTDVFTGKFYQRKIKMNSGEIIPQHTHTSKKKIIFPNWLYETNSIPISKILKKKARKF